MRVAQQEWCGNSNSNYNNSRYLLRIFASDGPSYKPLQLWRGRIVKELILTTHSISLYPNLPEQSHKKERDAGGCESVDDDGRLSGAHGLTDRLPYKETETTRFLDFQ